jgi:hypothetical protein
VSEGISLQCISYLPILSMRQKQVNIPVEKEAERKPFTAEIISRALV